MPRKPKAREAKKLVPKAAFWEAKGDPKSTPEVSLDIRQRLGQASGGQKKPKARKKTPVSAQERPKIAKKQISTNLAKWHFLDQDRIEGDQPGGKRAARKSLSWRIRPGKTRLKHFTHAHHRKRWSAD